MNTKRIIVAILEFIRNRRSTSPVIGNREDLTNTRFGITKAPNLKNKKNVVNTLLLMYSKENEALFI